MNQSQAFFHLILEAETFNEIWSLPVWLVLLASLLWVLIFAPSGTRIREGPDTMWQAKALVGS